MATGRRLIQLLGAGVIGFVGGAALNNVCQKNHVLASQLIPTATVPQEPDSYATRASQIMRFGFPSTDSIRSYDDFVLSYDRRNRTANWVFEHLNKESVAYNNAVDRSKCEFFPDPSMHPFFQSQNRDYKRSGYHRGHLAAAGNHRLSQKHVEQTFVLSNISPQVGQLNTELWNTLEKHVRHMTKHYKNIYVCTGPLYLPRREADGKTYVKYEVIGANQVAVPTHFFKVVVAETEKREYDLECYVMPNTEIDNSTPLHAFMVPVESVERAAGLLLFDKLPTQAFRTVNGRKR